MLYLKILITIAGVCCFYNFSFSQSTISGQVKSNETSENLIGAFISIKNRNIGTTTNNQGLFSIKSISKEDTLLFSYVGFSNKEIPISEIKNNPVEIILVPNTLDEITILGSKISTLKQAEFQISPQKLESIPVIGGEADIMKSLTLLPGLSQGSEGSSQLYVRGGTPDQNLMLLDGIQVYNANHLGGFFSTFNPQAINSINIYKGRFPSRYGGRLSSIIDVTSKKGSFNEYSGNASLGILTSSISFSGPIAKDKLKFHLSTRTSYLGLVNLFRDKSSLSDYLNYWLYDINFNTTFKLLEGELSFGSYFGNDIAHTINKSSTNSGDNLLRQSQTDADLNWGNNNLYLKYSTPLNNSVFADLTLARTTYNFEHINTFNSTQYFLNDTITEKSSFSNNSGVLDRLFNLNLNFNALQNLFIKTGINFTSHRYNTSSENDDSESLMTDLVATEFSTFIESSLTIKKIEVDIGLRFVNYNIRGNSFKAFEPRISLGFNYTENLFFFIDYSRNTQFIHLLSDQSFGLPVDIWVPATLIAKPSTSDQYSSGINLELNKSSIKADIYFKTMENLITFRSSEDSPFIRIGDWQNQIENKGLGTSYGIELLYEFSISRYSGFVSYTLAKSKRQFSNLNNNIPYPFLFDRRHDFALNTSIKISESTQINLNYIFQTGNPVTLPVAIIPSEDGEGRIPLFTVKNNGRLPNYSRIDVGLVYSKKLRNDQKIKYIFSIYNILNKKNPNAVLIDSKPIFDSNGNYLYHLPDIKTISYFPIIPGASINYEF